MLNYNFLLAQLKLHYIKVLYQLQLLTVKTLGEVGFVPYYQPGASAAIRATKNGVFLQGGYKFGLDSAGRKLLIGGQVDQSLEKINNLLFRMNGSLAINSDALIVDRKS